MSDEITASEEDRSGKSCELDEIDLEQQRIALETMIGQTKVDNARMERLLEDSDDDLQMTESTVESESFGCWEGSDAAVQQVLFSVGDLTSEQKSRVWYRRMGMPSLKTLQRATKSGRVKGLQVSSRLAVDDDPTVIEARFKAATYKSRETDTSKLPVLHTVSLWPLSRLYLCTVRH